MQREAATLGKIVDLLVSARPAEASDFAVQRLKALEAVSNGVHWSVANRLELLTSDKTMMASGAETLEAARRASAEEKLLQRASKPSGKGGEREQQAGGKSSGKGSKGKQEKGKFKEAKGKGDWSKADRKEGDK